MKNTKQKPIIVNAYQDEWEFVYPPEIDNEATYNQYWEGVELLDYDDTGAENIFKSLIKMHPYYIDAYVHLSIAFKNQKKLFESFITAEKAYSLGKSCFPKEFKSSKHHLPWGCLDNRPFLRACHVLGMEHQDKKEYENAISLYNEILMLNNNDNQGVRYLLLECFLSLKDFDQAEKLLKKHDDDWGIEFVYGKLIVAIIKNKAEKIDAILNDAFKRNKFVLEEIIKAKHVAPSPFRIPGEPYLDAGNPMGSVQEAYDYWKRNKSTLKDKRILSIVAKYLDAMKGV